MDAPAEFVYRCSHRRHRTRRPKPAGTPPSTSPITPRPTRNGSITAAITPSTRSSHCRSRPLRPPDIKLLTNVYIAAYRNPFLGAKSIQSLDVLSGGRLILGTAAGYLKPEFRALGIDFDNRGALLDEALDVLDEGAYRRGHRV